MKTRALTFPTLAVLLLALLVSATRPMHVAAQQTAGTSAEDPRCAALFEEAAGQLAAEQYPKMLRVATDRMRLCPDPESAFLLGLAQANMVDSFAVADPAEREQMRLGALRNLRVAAAGGTLKPGYDFTAHDWIVHLQRFGPPGWQDDDELEGRDLEEDAYGQEPEALEVPPAPPPQPQPVFPWGPVLTGAAATAAITTGIALAVAASDNRDEARSAANELRAISEALSPEELARAVRRTKALNDKADTEAQWSTIVVAGGAVAAVAAVVWYVALPPRGKWRWALAPTGVQASVRF